MDDKKGKVEKTYPRRKGPEMNKESMVENCNCYTDIDRMINEGGLGSEMFVKPRKKRDSPQIASKH